MVKSVGNHDLLQVVLDVICSFYSTMVCVKYICMGITGFVWFDLIFICQMY